MKEGIGYTLTLNIATVFIVVIFTFLSNVVIYYKGYKVSNMITSSIEKYEGFNDLAKNEIDRNLSSIGFNKKEISCFDDIKVYHKEIHGYDCLEMSFSEIFESDVGIEFIEQYVGYYKRYGVFNESHFLDPNINYRTYENGKNGYCVYKCMYSAKDVNHKNSTGLSTNEYFYIVKTNMYANIPILNEIINFNIYSDTNVMFDFEKEFSN